MYLLFQKILACVLHFNRTIWTQLCELDMEPYHQPTYTIPFIYTYSWVPILIFFLNCLKYVFGYYFSGDRHMGYFFEPLTVWNGSLLHACVNNDSMVQHGILVSQAFPLKFSKHFSGISQFWLRQKIPFDAEMLVIFILG